MGKDTLPPASRYPRTNYFGARVYRRKVRRRSGVGASGAWKSDVRREMFYIVFPGRLFYRDGIAQIRPNSPHQLGLDARPSWRADSMNSHPRAPGCPLAFLYATTAGGSGRPYPLNASRCQSRAIVPHYLVVVVGGAGGAISRPLFCATGFLSRKAPGI